MSEPTPGPWAWEYSDAGCSRLIALSASGRDVLICSEDDDGPRGYVSGADACLIAAAPDLLAACRRLIQEFADSETGGETFAWHMAGALDAAIAAVAKATGEGLP